VEDLAGPASGGAAEGDPVAGREGDGLGRVHRGEDVAGDRVNGVGVVGDGEQLDAHGWPPEEKRRDSECGRSLAY